jgi:hypothetical protein
LESVGEVLERVCPCGGDPSGPQHEESLLHRRWLLGQGLANHDPLADDDRRAMTDIVPIVENFHYLPRTSPERLR